MGRDDSRSHNVTADDGTFDSGAMAHGDSFSFTLWLRKALAVFESFFCVFIVVR